MQNVIMTIIGVVVLGGVAVTAAVARDKFWRVSSVAVLAISLIGAASLSHQKDAKLTKLAARSAQTTAAN